MKLHLPLEMKPMTFARPIFVAGLMGLAAASMAPVAGAQQVFRIVGPDGRVTFSDKAPVETTTRAAPAPAVPLGGVAGGGTPLPFELRQVASKYPVTLYTGTNCGPCGAGKAFLTSRGIPFVEKTISSNEDIEALQRLASDSSLPLLTVGGQQIKGYSDAEWGQFLDAAGYPKTSQLPTNFRNPPAEALVAVQRPAVIPTEAGRPGSTEAAPAVANRRLGTGQAPAAAPAPAPSNSNPAGIKF